jgi:transposase
MGSTIIQPRVQLEAVKPVKERGVSVTQAAKDLGLSQSVLGRWVRESAQMRSKPFLVVGR